MCVLNPSATILFFYLMTVGAFGQDNAPKVVIGGPPALLTEQLRRHRIELTESSLIKALQSTDPQVRDLAAAKLAEEKDMTAVPAISEALAKEKVTEIRIDMAFSLALLGQKKPVQELANDCYDLKLPGYFRARAILYTQRLGNKACFEAALGLLSSDPDSRQQILSLLPQYPHPSRGESEKIQETATRYLTDDSAMVRMQAGMTLAILGDPLAIPDLENAAAREQDDEIRSQLESSLEQLRKKTDRTSK
ncbi:MAG TPA: HEAT repeat domain-containing protein [Candidatus Sulfotelmatobacter sp.]